MSTSTPKNVHQPTSQPTTSKDTSQTSPSMSYPVMSLIKTVSPRGEPSKGPSSSTILDSSDKTISGYKSVEFKSEPAILPVTTSSQSSRQKSSSSARSEKLDKSSSVTTSQKGSSGGKSEISDKSSSGTTAQKSSTSGKSEKDKSPSEVSTQKSAARAAFFSSLSSPTSPTTTTSPLLSTLVPTTESPTETKSKTSSGRAVSPLRGIPALVRSSAVSMPYSSVATSASRTHPSMVTIPKPSSLPVSGGSTVVSSQRFSPASPSSSLSASGSSKSKATFTAIPKPYSPTKTIPSPITPESPKYRIHSSHIADSSGKKTVSVQSREPLIDSGSKKVYISQSRDTSSKSVTHSRDSGAKPKKVPPPPPPRKSSRLPGHAVLAVNAATLNGTLNASKSETQTEASISSAKTQVIRETIIDPPEEFANSEHERTVISDGDKESIEILKKVSRRKLKSDEKASIHIKDPTSVSKESSATQTLTDLNVKPDKCSESKKDKSEKLETDKSDKIDQGDKIAATVVNGEKSEKTVDTNGIDSSSSSSSLDSQLEVIWLKRDDSSKVVSSETKTSVIVPTTAVTSTVTSQIPSSVTSQSSATTGASGTGENASPKKPKPAPPERRSSLSSKTQTDSYDPSEEESKPTKNLQSSSDKLNDKSSADKKEGSPEKRSKGKSKSDKLETKDSDKKERKV